MWLKQITQWRAEGVPCALVTIIESIGSTPRKTGSNMTVRRNGEIAGSVRGWSGRTALHSTRKGSYRQGNLHYPALCI